MKNRKRSLFLITLFGLIGQLVITGPAQGRVMTGVLNGNAIRLQTNDLDKGEFVRAADLIHYFPGRWEYDGLSKTLIVRRQDGVQIGFTVGYQRIRAGNQVFPLLRPPILHEGRMYVPFHIVSEFLLPEAGLREENPDSSPPAQSITVQPTPVPFYLAPTTNAFSYATPTPTPVVFNDSFDTLWDTPTPFVSINPTPQSRTAPRSIVVIDPGIGGSPKSNSLRLGVRESDVTFGVSYRLMSLLTESPNIEVLITQQKDNPVPVNTGQRTGLANQNNANLFLSIQCGSLFSETVSKASVYYMNPELDEMTARANTRITIGQSPRWDDAYQPHVPESLRLARAVNFRLKEFYADASIISMESGPRPGRFGVLRGLTMPGIIIELGNLAHRDTAQYLSRERVQDYIADCLYQAVNDFIYERTGYQNSMPIQPE